MTNFGTGSSALGSCWILANQKDLVRRKAFREEKLSEDKLKKIQLQNLKKAEETKSLGFILFVVCSVLHVAISLVMWNLGAHLTLIPLVSIPIFFLLLWIGFWLKGAGIVNKNMRLPDSPMH